MMKTNKVLAMLLVLMIGGCTAAGVQDAPQTTVAPRFDVPPTIRAGDFDYSDPNSSDELPQLVGLTYEQAAQWAQDSGFKSHFKFGPLVPPGTITGDYTPTERVVFELDVASRVVTATRG